MVLVSRSFPRNDYCTTCDKSTLKPYADADTWLEEDLPITVHPKDPFKRVDLLPSTRPIRITIPNPSSSGDDITLASTPYSVHLHETLLPTRYYMPLSAIDVSLLQPSAKGTKTLCPYKGEAEYYVSRGPYIFDSVVLFHIHFLIRRFTHT